MNLEYTDLTRTIGQLVLPMITTEHSKAKNFQIEKKIANVQKCELL